MTDDEILEIKSKLSADLLDAGELHWACLRLCKAASEARAEAKQAQEDAVAALKGAPPAWYTKQAHGLYENLCNRIRQYEADEAKGGGRG